MNKWIVLLVATVAFDAQAWDECEHERKLDQVLNVADSTSLRVLATAGDLEIDGNSSSDEVHIRGRICASKAEWLEQMGVDATGGDTAEVAVRIPETSGWSLWGSQYAYIDLELQVPARLALDVKDSSGDIEIRGVSGLTVHDSAGDISLESVTGPVEVSDSSGDVLIEEVDGDLLIDTDSSGDVRARGVTGSVTVRVDSSGDLRFTDIGSDVTVERDSSGDISVSGVGGNFTVLRDGSGSIHSDDVKGKVSVPD